MHLKRDVYIGVDNGINEKMSGCDVLSSMLKVINNTLS